MTPFVNKASRLSLFLSPDFIDACRGDGKSDRDECVSKHVESFKSRVLEWNVKLATATINNKKQSKLKELRFYGKKNQGERAERLGPMFGPSPTSMDLKGLWRLGTPVTDQIQTFCWGPVSVTSGV